MDAVKARFMAMEIPSPPFIVVRRLLFIVGILAFSVTHDTLIAMALLSKKAKHMLFFLRNPPCIANLWPSGLLLFCVWFLCDFFIQVILVLIGILKRGDPRFHLGPPTK